MNLKVGFVYCGDFIHLIELIYSLHFWPFTAEFLTWLKVNLKPTPNAVHYLLTHFKGFWNIINNISFLRDAIMRYVLTCKSLLAEGKVRWIGNCLITH